MGNQHGHGSKSGTATPNSIASSHNGSRKSITRTSSGADIQEKPTQMLPVEKLAKVTYLNHILSQELGNCTLLYDCHISLKLCTYYVNFPVIICSRTNNDSFLQILTEKSQKLESVNGITKDVFSVSFLISHFINMINCCIYFFQRFLFPRYPVLGEKLFNHFLKHSKSKNKHIGLNAFKHQCEIYLGVSSY